MSTPRKKASTKQKATKKPPARKKAAKRKESPKAKTSAKQPLAAQAPPDDIDKDLWPLVRPIASLTPDPKNSNRHDPRSIETLKYSLARFGQTRPVKVDKNGIVTAGNGLMQAAIELGWTTLAVSEKDFGSDEERLAYALIDNRSAQLSALDYELVSVTLQEIEAAGVEGKGAEGLGWTDEEVTRLLADDVTPPKSPDYGDEQTKEKPDGGAEFLAVANVSIDEPREVETGEVWQLGKHRLFVASVMTDWALYYPFLLSGKDSILCPYPGPFVALGSKADDHTLILVHPSKYVAGHIIDRYAEVYGEDSVKLEKVKRG